MKKILLIKDWEKLKDIDLDKYDEIKIVKEDCELTLIKEAKEESFKEAIKYLKEICKE